MKRYYVYTRVSTVKQGEQGVSLQEQRDAIARYAERYSLKISEWFEEKETAAKRGRPIFGRMISLLRTGKADGVIIHKIDRSARNLKDWADLGELIDKGIDIHFANESLDLNSRGGRLSADIQAVVAADFIRNLREETRKGFYGRIKQGLYPLPAPLGYLDMGRGKPKEPDPERAPLIRKTFEIYGNGKFSLNGLAEEIYCLGLRNRNDKRVSINGLSVILNNPFYMGLIKLRSTGEIFQGCHKPLISKAQFSRVQNVLSGKSNSKIQRHDFLFRRLFQCKNCGYSLIGETQKGYTYYRCHTKHCHTTCIRETIVENKVKEKLSLIQFEDQELTYLKDKVDELRDDWEGEKKNHINTMNLNLKRIEDRLDRLTDAYVDQLITKDVFERRKESLLMDRRGLEDSIAGIKDGTHSIPDKVSRFLELAGSVIISYETGLTEEKRDLLKSVTSNRQVDGKNVEVELYLPFQEVANRHKIQYCVPYRDRPRTFYLDLLLDRLFSYFKSIEDNEDESKGG